ncbi:DUF6318 family protein [Amycolatopsis cynarae]|uniref:DUF6318 family protein n=1 Tax=Amycolatopsis cynarae TaxID=2995223 RepID=A0ABY7B2I9_9PSEU|nr:DUF6318 family protein [Amycolatopsis sp. HUAS 11-8]WAL65437.1 DUF6318 family protein [Amycolatopsis sp. HUAS 11-8]
MSFRVPALISIALLVLTACDSGAAGKDTPPPWPTIPPMPSGVAKSDRLGATGFASHFIDLMDYAYQSLDAAPLRDLGLPSCQACRQFLSQLDTDRAAGTHYQGGRVHFLSAEPESVDEGKQAVVDAMFDQDELKVLDAHGTTVETVPANRTIFVFALRWTESGWRAESIKLGTPTS